MDISGLYFMILSFIGKVQFHGYHPLNLHFSWVFYYLHSKTYSSEGAFKMNRILDFYQYKVLSQTQ